MYNLLTNSGVLGYGVEAISEINLNWIGQIIKWLIEGVGIVGIGIVIFTLILKTIVLPLDIYSKIMSKKQALIMERMRPQMEKLQKQYANDKQMYNQKVMELQKSSGYSMFGACLPMIVSLVIFIIVFNAFSTYSQYANLHSYNEMVKEYNSVVETYVISDDNQDGFLTAVDEDLNEVAVAEAYDFVVDYDKFAARYNKDKKEEAEKAGETWTEIAKTDDVFADLAKEYIEQRSGYAGTFSASDVNYYEGEELSLRSKELRNSLVSYYISGPAALKVKDYYENGHNNSFLWVKNIWYPDSTLNKEIPSFSKFKSTLNKANISSDAETAYNSVTGALTKQKNSYNGYYILIVISIGVMLLQQWLSMRSNKSVNELSTVDGSAARTNKMMMIMMPVIYGIFSFFYSAAFSIYMITNSLYGLITSIIINKCVDVWFKKKEANGELEQVLSKKNRKNKAKKNRR